MAFNVYGKFTPCALDAGKFCGTLAAFSMKTLWKKIIFGCCVTDEDISQIQSVSERYRS
jgi:hypothetical protein